MITKHRLCFFWRQFILLSLLLLFLWIPSPSRAQQLAACATVPDLGSLLQEIGGTSLKVTVFAKGTEDAHFIEPRPSYVRDLNECDLYLQVGLDLEMGWMPRLLQNARNPRITPSFAAATSNGYLDASAIIAPLQISLQAMDRSMGDIHPRGNPHYLVDPLNGLRVARLIRDRLSELKPEFRSDFAQRYDRFAQAITERLLGTTLATKYGVENVEKLAQLYAAGKLSDYLKSQNEAESLGGWFGRMLPHFGQTVVDDHNMWPYFAQRFGVEILGHLEPKPGIPPTTAHMQELIKLMRSRGTRILITAPYYDPRYIRFMTENSDVVAVPLAHMVGARPGAETYIGMIDYNIEQLATAFDRLK